jgi:hypothetical protein
VIPVACGQYAGRLVPKGMRGNGNAHQRRKPVSIFLKESGHDIV